MGKHRIFAITTPQVASQAAVDLTIHLLSAASPMRSTGLLDNSIKRFLWWAGVARMLVVGKTNLWVKQRLKLPS